MSEQAPRMFPPPANAVQPAAEGEAGQTHFLITQSCVIHRCVVFFTVDSARGCCSGSLINKVLNCIDLTLSW